MSQSEKLQTTEQYNNRIQIQKGQRDPRDRDGRPLSVARIFLLEQSQTQDPTLEKPVLGPTTTPLQWASAQMR